MSRWRQFRSLFGPEPEADVDDELRFHLEMRTHEMMARGIPEAQAQADAGRRFGDYAAARRACVETDRRQVRRSTRATLMADLRQDLAYGLRTLGRAPGFALVVVLALAIGIGATTAMFSVVHAVLLQPLAYPQPEQLHVLQMVYPDGTRYTALSAPDFASVRQHTRAFAQVEAFTMRRAVLLDAGEPREVLVAAVTDDAFGLLGFQTRHGRAFLREEHQPERGGVTVLAHGFWQRTFGGDPAVVGRVVSSGSRRLEIVGVLGPDHRLPLDADLFVPLEYDDTFSASAVEGRRSEYLGVLARERAGIGEQAVGADLQRLSVALQEAFPDTNGRLTIGSLPLDRWVVGEVATPLRVLLGAVALVLLVACANVANLLLARGSVRQGELSVRAALGASRPRLVRQLLTESVVLGLLGGAAGVGLAWLAVRVLVAAEPVDLPRLDQVSVNGPVVLVGLATGLLTSIVFGLLPAWQATRGNQADALRESGRSQASGGAGQRTRAMLVVAEIALAVVLLVGAGLLVRSFVAMTAVDPGFATANGATFRVTLQGEGYEEGAGVRARVDELEAALRALPGVRAVASTSVLPLSGLGALSSFAVEGAPPPPADVNREIALASVTPTYFTAIGVPLRSGRTFTEWDRADAPAVAVINESGARRWFPGQNPIGRRVDVDDLREIVGVVADIRQRDVREAVAPQLFVPHAQRSVRAVRVVVRTDGDPMALVPAIREQLQAVDARLPFSEVTRLDALVSSSLSRPRFFTTLLTAFAGVALMLAGIGVLGVMNYVVAQRTREIGVRLAIGAAPRSVVQLIVGGAVRMAGAGLAIGLVGALLLGRVLEAQLFGVSVADPLTLACVVALLAVCALAASVLPARRAARLDPATVLRDG